MRVGPEGWGGDASAGLVPYLEFLGLLPDPQAVEEAVGRQRAASPALSSEDLARRIVRRGTWLLTGAGAVAALPGAIPGLGTLVQVGVSGVSITAETWMILRNLSSMQMLVAHTYGNDIRNPNRPDKLHPDRLDEVAIVWGLQTGLIVPAKEATGRIGTKIAVNVFNQQVSGELLKRINKKLGTTVLTKFGTKRGGIALGRLVPFGVGAGVGAGMNYLSTRGFGAWCIKYYCEMKPGGDDLVLID